MTDSSGENLNIESLLIRLIQAQLRTQEQIDQTQQQLAQTQVEIAETNGIVRSLASDVEHVLGRNAIINDVVLEMRENFEDHQRTTNAALASLEAINLNLLEIIRGREGQ